MCRTEITTSLDERGQGSAPSSRRSDEAATLLPMATRNITAVEVLQRLQHRLEKRMRPKGPGLGDPSGDLLKDTLSFHSPP
jgi:hypothetical protein